jgi:hypothetical protein
MDVHSKKILDGDSNCDADPTQECETKPEDGLSNFNSIIRKYLLDGELETEPECYQNYQLFQVN